MPKIKDVSYKQFLQTGLIDIINKDRFKDMLANVEHKYKKQARALFIILYYGGRRPVEVLDLMAENIKKERQRLRIMFPTAKKGRYTTLYMPMRNEHINEFYKYASKLFPKQYIFWAFRGGSSNRVKYLSGGTTKFKNYVRTTARLYYWFRKWCKLPPYYFRHNRFSTMAQEGATIPQIAHAKGAADMRSVMPYVHMSKAEAAKLIKYYK